MQPEIVVQVVREHVAGWSSVSCEDVTVEASPDTEWHQVFFLSSDAGRVVVNVPSWTAAALENKLQASRAAAASGLGPQLLAVVEWEGRQVMVSEYFDGGTLKPADIDLKVLRDIGKLYAQFHCLSPAWFDPVHANLVQEGLLGEEQASWASCLWILPWLQRLVPEANRVSLKVAGVDWDFLEAEIKSLPADPALPSDGPSARMVCVHGDSHPGNIMWHRGSLRLIDFDMTAPGPAGSELAYIVLMLFRCGFSQDAILPRDAQRQFALGYLETMGAAAVDEAALDGFLFDMHRWAYVGLLKMGLLCAVLMHSEGNPGKREVMQKRGPVLLNPGFLKEAKEVMRAAVSDGVLREALLTQGLFFVTEGRWQASRA